jgi:nicotinamide-nucleotide amidase
MEPKTMMTNVSADELDFVQIDRKLIELAVEALERAKCAGLRVVTAESCTGGLIATVLSEAPGAAEYLKDRRVRERHPARAAA